jgi:hypothetical protein
MSKDFKQYQVRYTRGNAVCGIHDTLSSALKDFDKRTFEYMQQVAVYGVTKRNELVKLNS